MCSLPGQRGQFGGLVSGFFCLAKSVGLRARSVAMTTHLSRR